MGTMKVLPTRTIVIVIALCLLLATGCAEVTGSGPALTLPPSPAEPPWWNERVFYQVFARSFYDSSGDGNGDLQGLIDKLDYLNDGDPSTTSDLGITGIWLMPVTESPSYHGYDVVDYRQIAHDYGSNDDFKQLIAEAHRRGIAVIVDLVINHTSSLHPWFIDAQTPGSEYEEWYIWRNEKPAFYGPGGRTVWHESGNRYYYGYFWSEMPDINLENPKVTEAVHEIARFWLEEMGVDGFRLDAVKYLIEAGQEIENTAETHAWLERFHPHVKSIHSDALLIGEVWDSSHAIAPYIGTRLDLAFSFDLASDFITSVRRGNADLLRYDQQQALDLFPAGQYAAFLTNHDQNRVMSELNGSINAAKVAATLLLTNPGVPFIYYGEEIGMTGYKPDENIRTPMQWDGTPDTAGFTTGTPWYALQPDYRQVHIAAQTADPGSLLSHYRALIRLRQAHPALSVGGTLLVESNHKAVYGLMRFTPEETVLVLANVSAQAVTGYHLTLSEGPPSRTPEAVMLFGEGQPTAPIIHRSGGFDAYTPLPELPPYSSFVIHIKPRETP
ncbi:MAG: DUF3459 domain-containing protein [Anaerolineae bacterium]|nr:DUF3459 domain-containing protein [Anaerolineae bacterium]